MGKVNALGLSFSLVGAGMLCSLCPVGASEQAPFFTSTKSPFARIFGLPPAERGGVAETGKTETRLVFDATNNFSGSSSSRESIQLDGEMYEFSLVLRHGIFQKFELGIDVPYVAHDEGVLDSFIEGWHDAFGFSGGGRNSVGRNQLSYTYTRDGTTRESITKSSGGIGDLRLFGAYQLLGGTEQPERSLALRCGVELPTGSATKLHGSGSTDVSLGLAASDTKTLSSWRAALFGSAGVLYLSDGDVLEEIQRNVVGYGSIGICSRQFRRVNLKAQLDFHSAFYHSDMKEIGAASAQLILGGTVALTEKTLLDIGVAEDVAVDTASDVVFHLSLFQQF